MLGSRPVTVARVTLAAGRGPIVQALDPPRYCTSNSVSSDELSVQETTTTVEPAGVVVTPEGAAGAAPEAVVATPLGDDSPLAFFANTRNSWLTPDWSPPTVTDSSPAAGSAPNTVHALAPTKRYSTTKLVSSDEASVQVRLTLVEVAVAATRPTGAAGGIVNETTGLSTEPLELFASTRNS